MISSWNAFKIWRYPKHRFNSWHKTLTTSWTKPSRETRARVSRIRPALTATLINRASRDPVEPIVATTPKTATTIREITITIKIIIISSSNNTTRLTPMIMHLTINMEGSIHLKNQLLTNNISQVKVLGGKIKILTFNLLIKTGTITRIRNQEVTDYPKTNWSLKRQISNLLTNEHNEDIHQIEKYILTCK